MGALCKSSPQKQKTTSESTSRSGPEQWMLDAGQQGYQQAAAAAARPYDPRTQASVESFSPAQQLAFNASAENVGSWRPGYQQATGVAEDTSKFFASDQAERYMNPFEDKVIAALERQSKVRRAGGQFDRFRNAGVWGGRRGVAEGVEADRLNSQIAQLLYSGYNDALSGARQDVGIRAGGAADLARYASGASGLGYGDAAQQYGYGAIQQAQGQNVRDAAQQNAMAEFAYPQQQAAWLQSMLRGTPSATEATGTGTTTQTASGGDPSKLMQLAYLASVGASFIPGGGGATPPAGAPALPPAPAPPPPPSAGGWPMQQPTAWT